MTTFWLCREFGWTPQQVRQQSAKDIERLTLILNQRRALQEQLGPLGEGGTTILVSED